MNIVNLTVKAVMRRPSILLVIAGLMLLAAVVNAFIPIMAMIMGIVSMAGGGVFESVLSILQMLLDPGVLPAALVLVGALTLIAAVVAGLLLPGYLLAVDDAIGRGEKRKGPYAEGLKTCFFSFFLRTVKAVLCTVLLAVFLMVACVPAIVVTKAAFSTKPELMAPALFVDFITVGVLFMCLSFFQAYLYMWYIAAAKGAEKPFKTGKSVADGNFWSIAFNLLAFDTVFAVVIYVIYLSDSQFFRYAAGWAFASCFFPTLAVYLVRTFRETFRDGSSKRSGS